TDVRCVHRIRCTGRTPHTAGAAHRPAAVADPFACCRGGGTGRTRGGACADVVTAADAVHRTHRRASGDGGVACGDVERGDHTGGARVRITGVFRGSRAARGSGSRAHGGGRG